MTMMMRRFGLGVLAYLAPTFALGFVWHLILFARYFSAVQWAIVGPLTALAFAGAARKEPAAA